MRAAGCALLFALCCAPAQSAPAAADDKKVWRALTEHEPREAPPAASSRAAPAAPRAEKTFPSEIALGLVAAGLLVLAGAASALTAARRSRPAPAAVPAARKPDEGSPVENLWRVHLRRRGPGRGTAV